MKPKSKLLQAVQALEHLNLTQQTRAGIIARAWSLRRIDKGRMKGTK